MDDRFARDLDDLRRLVARLRAPDGCPWDRDQRLPDLRSHLLEEAHEVAAAIDDGDWGALREELGDLLFQIAFLLQLGTEAGELTTAEVVAAVAGKMTERHPHVFGTERLESAEEVERAWGRRKLERGGSASVLAGVAASLPALVEADRLTRKAAAVGFDWGDPGGVLDKLEEEMAELREALVAGAGGEDAGATAEELGDLLFTAVNLARHLRIDAEGALAGANRKFRRRFARVEQALEGAGRSLPEATLEEMEEAWSKAKADDGA